MILLLMRGYSNLYPPIHIVLVLRYLC